MKQHHKRNTRLYSIWAGMKTRCYNKNHIYYRNYGGRGIEVCEEWKKDFFNFYNWAINNGYKDELTIDRKNNDGNYCPENCRWSTTIEQSNNKRNNRLIDINGKLKSISEWSRISKNSVTTIRERLKRGWTPYDAVFQEPKKKGYSIKNKTNRRPNHIKKVEINGEEISMAEAARKYGVSYYAMVHRIRRGQTPQQAIDSLL